MRNEHEAARRSLRSILRQADPARHDPGLDAQQQAVIRDAMLRAIDPLDGLPRLTGLLAVAALVIVSLATAVLVAVGFDDRIQRVQPTHEVVATAPEPPGIASLTDADADADADAGNVIVEAGPTDPRSTTTTRTILFTTHNGTQIIWTLDPRFALPAPASATRGEKS